MGEPALKSMTIDEFIVWAEKDPEVKYELVHGHPRAMSGGSEAHSQIGTNIAFEIRTRLRPPCRVLNEASITRDDRDDRYYVADVAVTCSPPEPGRRFIKSPVLIVEVLSDSTANHDRGTKVPDYMQIPSVQEILLVDSREARAQLWRRDGRRWIVEDFTGDASLPLMSIDAELPLSAIYEGVAF
ncbi:Uma2 family endonuclease [Azospirillum sp.]|uniref:Uma2 family endonuclease n=1 Tax=Azospirillum sp. TaxID=34012 RepID=UPI002D741747|nr:Uma2 family endonuclease [Azospirillum sp.]HYD67057.1 Uma2 family endonuclease [Azospirillum sp.]